MCDPTGILNRVYSLGPGGGLNSAYLVYSDTPMVVESITMSTIAKSGRVTAWATVRVVDDGGVPVANASVTGHWTGLTSGTATLTTPEQDDPLTGAQVGIVVFKSASLRNPVGTFTFVVDSVTVQGYAFDCQHGVTTNSISYP